MDAARHTFAAEVTTVSAPDPDAGRMTLAWRLSWSPDGRQIAFSTYSGPGISVVAPDGSGLTRISETGSSPSSGPRGPIAFCAENSPYNGDT